MTRRWLARAKSWQVAIMAMVCAGGGFAAPSFAAEPPTAIIVFDGSGSMWGRLESERQAKFAIAREALKAPMSSVKSDVRLGLASYGHRRQADCSDVQVIVPPEAGAAERVGTALERLNPKGKGPVGNGLREASKALGKGPGRKSLILVHDDPDNCSVDVCALLGELQSNAPGLVIHAVGLGLKPEDAQKMQCLTKPTGGKLFDAHNAAQVTSALDEAVRLASLDAEPAQLAPKVSEAAPASPVVKPAAAGSRRPLATEGPPALRLATLLIGETEPKPRVVRWTISDEKGALVTTATGQDVLVPLAAGRYVVDLADGLVQRRETVTVGEKGHTAADLALDAGAIKLPALVADGSSSALVTLSEAATGSRGKTIAVAALRDVSPIWVVPPGRYTIAIEQGGARWEQAVEIAKGTTADLPAISPFGQLQVSVGGANVKAARLLLRVLVDDPEAPRGLREVTRTASSNAAFTLPAGTYAVIASQGALEVRDRLSIAAGDVVQRALTLGGAQLSVTSRLAVSGAMPADDPVSYRISRIDVVPPQAFTSVERTPQLDLPAGRYRIEARQGLLNAKAIHEIDLAPGQKASVVLEQQAGILLLQPPAAHQGELFWQILDGERRMLWGTAQPAPRTTLQAGRYIIRAETRGKTYERTIELKAGQVLPVQMTD